MPHSSHAALPSTRPRRQAERNSNIFAGSPEPEPPAAARPPAPVATANSPQPGFCQCTPQTPRPGAPAGSGVLRSHQGGGAGADPTGGVPGDVVWGGLEPEQAGSTAQQLNLPGHQGCECRSSALCQGSRWRWEGAEVLGSLWFNLACLEGERFHMARAGTAGTQRPAGWDPCRPLCSASSLFSLKQRKDKTHSRETHSITGKIKYSNYLFFFLFDDTKVQVYCKRGLMLHGSPKGWAWPRRN